MKKSLFTKWAMAMAAVFSMASCSQEEEIVNPTPNVTKRTVFSSGTDGTRTTIDKSRTYFWQFNDQIWVNDGGTWLKSSDSELAPDQKSANFYYDKLLTAPSYEVVYTGYASRSATEVTIPATFRTAGNIATNIGNRGDCGVATATRNENGTYSFALLHKASYLGVAPLQVSYLNKRYKWSKIEVTEVNGQPIAGTFGFSPDGIDVSNVTSPSSTITLSVDNINDAGTYLQNYNSDFSYIYTVIPPANRKLNVKYYFVDVANPTQEYTMTVVLNARQFIENNVVQFRHGLNLDFYQWDAPITEPYDVTRINPNVNFNNAAPFTQASQGCATMPNPNEMYWYLLNGDPRWDGTTEWTVDGGASYHTGGVWIKKKDVILREGNEFNSTKGFNDVDMRTAYTPFSVTNSNYTTGGKPADDVINKYFFLPALGRYANANLEFIGERGVYWISTSIDPSVLPAANGEAASYSLTFTNAGIYINWLLRRTGAVGGNGSDWFK